MKMSKIMSKFKRALKRIKLNFKHFNFLYFFKRKYEQIKNLFKWIPVIWKQYDFDYGYALDAFKFQLSKIADFLESDKANTVEAKNSASRIRMIVRLMEKVYNEDYGCEYQSQIEELYGKTKTEFVPSLKNPNHYQMEEIFERKFSKKEIDEIKLKKKELFNKSQEKQKRAHILLWKLIEHNIQNWWD